MAKMTLLEIVQSALNSMDSDRVDSISDTEESSQIALVAKEVYYNLINREEWEFLNKGILLTSPADPNNPTQFDLPDNIRFITRFSYNVSTTPEKYYKDLEYLSHDEFFRRTATEGTVNTQEVTIDSGLRFFVRTDHMPQYFTTVDDRVLICDAFDSDVESFLDPAKVSASAITIPTWTESDSFVPELPTHFFPLFLAEVKNASHRYFKQAPSAQDEVRVAQQLAQLRRQSARTHTKHEFLRNKYGRR